MSNNVETWHSQLCVQCGCADGVSDVDSLGDDVEDVVVMDIGKDGDGLAQDQRQPHHNVAPLSLQETAGHVCQGYLHAHTHRENVISFIKLFIVRISGYCRVTDFTEFTLHPIIVWIVWCHYLTLNVLTTKAT